MQERVLGAEHPDTLTARANLARWTGEAGDATGARDQLTALLLADKRVLGAEHPHTLTARANLARWTGLAGDPAGARDQLTALLPVRVRVLGAENPHTLRTRANLAGWTGEAGDAASARDQLAALLPVQERVLGAVLMNGMSLVQMFIDRSVPWIWSFLIGISGAFNLLIGVLLLSSTALAVPLVFATLLLVEGASLIMLAFRVRT